VAFVNPGLVSGRLPNACICNALGGHGDMPAGARKGTSRVGRLTRANQDRIEQFRSGHRDLLLSREAVRDLITTRKTKFDSASRFILLGMTSLPVTWMGFLASTTRGPAVRRGTHLPRTL
jgi:hypothetical protein